MVYHFVPVDHVLSELSTMTQPSSSALHGMAHSFIELDKALVQVIRLAGVCDCGFQSVCPVMEKHKRYMEASSWERLTMPYMSFSILIINDD